MPTRIIEDKKGRKLEIQELTPSMFLDILEAAESGSTNGGFLRYAQQIYSVISIDGVPLLAPKNKRDLKRNADQIGNEGLTAIYDDQFPKMEGDETPEQAAERYAKSQAAKEEETAKN
jgi:hypothetical protein